MIRSRSIGTKFFFIIFFVLLLTAGVYILVIIDLQQRSFSEINEINRDLMEISLREEWEKKAQAFTLLLANELIQPSYNFDIYEMNFLTGINLGEKDIRYVYVLDEKGRVLVDGTKDAQLMGTLFTDQLTRRAIAAPGLLTQKHNGIVDVSAPIQLGEKRLATVRIGFDDEGIQNAILRANTSVGESIDQAIAASIRNALFLSGIVVVLALALGLVFIRGIVSPIKMLLIGTQKIAAGDLDYKVDIGAKDEVGRLALSFNEMTDSLMKAGEALQASEEKFRKIFDRAKDAILINAPEGRIVDVNQSACRMLGYAREELLSMNVSDLMPKGILVRQPEEIKGGAMREDLCSETVNARKDGSLIPVEVSNTLAEIGGDKRVIAIVRDITERKRLEDQLRHVQKMEAIGTLAGGLAHNFNNILAGIMGYASLAKGSLDRESSLIPEMERIETLVQRGADLTRALLAFSRKGAYNLKVLHVNSLVNNVLKIIGETTGKAIDIKAELSQAVSNVSGDEGQLYQVFMNLCLNACEAMPEGGALSIRAADAELDEGFFKIHSGLKKGPYIFISVSDTGAGMDFETRKRIFEPFFTTKLDRSGTGLGLAMVIGIVEAHGGCIEVESEPGRGSTFTIYLPATAGKIREVPPKPVGILRGDETILVIDDEEGFRDSMGCWLRGLGYKVIEAASGEDALKALEKKKEGIDLVLLDMIMKGMGGAKTFRRLRKIVPDLPVIICTGYSIDKTCQQLLRERTSDFIQKPFESKSLASKVRAILDNVKCS